MAVAPYGRYLYTADGSSNRVSVLDTRTKRVVASVRVGTQPLSVAVAPDGKKIYAANSGSGDVSVIDALANRVVRAIPAGRFPSGVAVTPDGASLYVTNELSGVTVISADNGTVQARLREPSPFSVTISPDGDRADVTSLGPGKVTAIDTEPIGSPPPSPLGRPARTRSPYGLRATPFTWPIRERARCPSSTRAPSGLRPLSRPATARSASPSSSPGARTAKATHCPALKPRAIPRAHASDRVAHPRHRRDHDGA